MLSFAARSNERLVALKSSHSLSIGTSLDFGCLLVLFLSTVFAPFRVLGENRFLLQKIRKNAYFAV